ncbi:MAG: hypothetical protein R6U44_08105 [Archaeoglobaceae archaeon]
MERKELTGYHLAIFALVLVIVHFPFAAGVGWSLTGEIEAIIILSSAGSLLGLSVVRVEPLLRNKKVQPPKCRLAQRMVGSTPRVHSPEVILLV